MISHYLKISLRAIGKNPLLSLLNILGLSVGFGCFLVITLYLYQENTYEKGFTDYDKIYRIEEEFLVWAEVLLQPLICNISSMKYLG